MHHTYQVRALSLVTGVFDINNYVADKAPVPHLFLLPHWESILPPCGIPTGEVSEGWWLGVPNWLEHTADLPQWCSGPPAV